MVKTATGNPAKGDTTPENMAKAATRKKTARKAPVVPKSRRCKRGTKALREIRRYQKSTELLIQKLPFKRLVKEIAQNFHPEGMRWKKEAVEAIQESAEAFLTAHFELLLKCAFHAERVTVTAKDHTFLLDLMKVAVRSIGGYYIVT
ncbi:hypothetical protein ACHAO1_011125 [Botrytis cinerea]